MHTNLIEAMKLTDNQYVYLYTFMYPQQYIILRTRLESENIDFRFTNELTIQVQPFYSNAVGGIDLFVRQADAERTKEILRDFGYDPEILRPSIIARLDSYTAKIPYIGRISFPIRAMSILIMVLLFLLGVFLLVELL